MHNIISKSIFYIFFSFILLTLFIFFYNSIYSLFQLERVVKYIFFEYITLIVILSQFFYILFDKSKTFSNIVINVFICWSIILIHNYSFSLDHKVLLSITKNTEVYVTRDISYFNQFNIFRITVIEKFIDDIKCWNVSDHFVYSSLVLLLFNNSLISFIDRVFINNTILKVFSFIIYVLFIIYIWNSLFNITLLIMSFYLLNSWRGE